MRVIFYTVKNAEEKVRYLLVPVLYHFNRSEKIKIVVPDQKTRDFIDTLLWKHPEEGFLPHCTSLPAPFEDGVYISLQKEVQGYPFVFNLSPDPYHPSGTCNTLYELEDISTPGKKAVFEKKFAFYKNLGCRVAAGRTDKNA